MPGYADWKLIYKEEYVAMYEEGYDVSHALMPCDVQELLPFPGRTVELDHESHIDWRVEYERLWACRKQGLRADYPYREPTTWDEMRAEFPPLPTLVPLSAEAYEDRLSGAVNGRIAGVILGKPFEMGMDRRAIRAYLESIGEYPLMDYASPYSSALDRHLRADCLPSTKGNIHYAQPDDDIHYTLLALRLAEKHGLRFTPYDIGINFLENIPYHWCWCASRQAYYRMVNMETERSMEEQLAMIPWEGNPWRECIDGQIRTDLWGYLFPGDPRGAAEIAYRDCSFSLAKNGCYGGMFVAGCIASALTANPTVDEILDGGLSVIPQRSRLAETIRWVRERYAMTNDWEVVCQEIETRFAKMAFAGTMNNLAMTVLALLHGNLDYTKTITCAVSCGIDTDCNGGTAGSICGAAIGRCGIEDRWLTPLQDTIHSCVAEIGYIGISELVDRIINLHKNIK